jgi:hypothetical protein
MLATVCVLCFFPQDVSPSVPPIVLESQSNQIEVLSFLLEQRDIVFPRDHFMRQECVRQYPV